MGYTLVKDAFINFKFMPQAQLMAGLFLDPWSRVGLGDLYSFIVPLENFNPGISENRQLMVRNCWGALTF